MHNQSPEYIPLTDLQKSPEITPETIGKAINVSALSRKGVQDIFAKFGKPLSESLPGSQKNNTSVRFNTGNQTVGKRPEGEEHNTGGVQPDFKKGDTYVKNEKGWVESKNNQVEWDLENLNSQQIRVNDAVQKYDYWKGQSSFSLGKANDFENLHQSDYQEIWKGQEKGELIWGPDPSGSDQYILLRSNLPSSITQERIDELNRINADSRKLWNEVFNIQDITKSSEKIRDDEFRNLQWYTKFYTQAKDNLTVAQKSLKDAEHLRYRYLMKGVDFDKKVDATKQAWKGIFGKEVDRKTVVNHYINSVDHLGAFMTNIQTRVIKNEKDYVAHLEGIGSSLSPEEKLLFLGMVGTNLQSRTYNWDQAKSGDLKNVSVWQSMQSLAQSFATNESVPAGVCSSIHVAVSKIAEQWGIPASTLTVSSGGVGHVVSLLDIGGKKVISDYGKLYTAPTIEGLLDQYAVSNRGALIRNYITDANGVIIGHVETPLSKSMRKELLSRTNIDDFLSQGITEKNGTNIEWYNNRKAISGKYTFENGFHIGARIADSTLISGVNAKTTDATIGYTKQTDLGNGWNIGGTIEGHVAKSNIRYDGEINQVGETKILQAQGGIRLAKQFNNGGIHTGVGFHSVGQGQDSKGDEYSSIRGLGRAITGESGMNFNAGGTVAVTPTTLISGEYSLESNRGTNVQSRKSSDLNPFQGQNYYTHTLRGGVAEKLNNGDEIFGKGEIQNTPLSNETTIGIGYQSNNTKATIEQTNIRATHVFGPTNQDMISANIQTMINTKTSLFAKFQKGGIQDRNIHVGVKFEF